MASAHLKWRHRAGTTQKICVESMREHTRSKNYIFSDEEDFWLCEKAKHVAALTFFLLFYFLTFYFLPFTTFNAFRSKKELFGLPDIQHKPSWLSPKPMSDYLTWKGEIFYKKKFFLFSIFFLFFHRAVKWVNKSICPLRNQFYVIEFPPQTNFLLRAFLGLFNIFPNDLSGREPHRGQFVY
jgi:hypothetical protein